MASSWNRPTAVAGTFYPRESEKLLRMLGEYLAPPAEEHFAKQSVPAVVAPHAGYIYSGAIAGSVYRLVNIPSTVFILCPNHSGMGKRISVWNRGGWQTPLGDVPVDESLADAFLEAAKEPGGDRDAHLHEHAIEVHLPFLKYLQPELKIIPITLGPLQLSDCLRLGQALAKVILSVGDEETLIVASTDMSHYISSDSAKKADAPALKAIEALSGDSLYRSVVENEISMCGFIPTTTVLEAAKKLGASKGEIIRYGNSGDTTKDYKSVVAYAAARIQ